MEENKYIEIRCPYCGKLIAKILYGNTGVMELVCTRNICKSVFYVVDGEVVEHPSIHIRQIFKKV